MTIMNSHTPYLLISNSRVVITVLLYLLLISPVSCFNQHQQAPTSSRGLLFEEKARLGSTPPSCHNKCNDCHPCMAVQVPTLPSHDPVEPGLTKTNGFFEPSPAGNNRYSNYKPLGWKCHCGDHFYNP